MVMNREEYKDLINRSKERCRQYGIEKKRVNSKKILGYSELQAKFSMNRDLVLTATPYIENLMSIVRGKNFFVILTDKEGCILNVTGDEKILSEAFDLKMIPGAYMNEDCIGTNAMSLVINSGEPVQISGDEHYIEAYHRWTCSGAPIKDANGNFVGVLDLTGYINEVHPHTLGMVIAASNAIEEMLKVKQYNRLQDATNKHVKTIFDSMPVAILTIDLEGNVKLHNKKFIELVGNKYKYNISRDINEIIEDWDIIKEAITLDKNVTRIVKVNSMGKPCRCKMTASPVYNPQDDSIEIILILRKDNLDTNKKNPDLTYTFEKIVGKDRKFLTTIEYAKKIANNRSTILIQGESGCGKEVFAQAIHNYSKRVDEPFVALNCGAIPKQLIESELFGYADGAYTGAKRGGNIGKFEQANNGTIMLDEIGEMPLDMQIRLLRVLQENTITKIGSQKVIPIDVRIIAATNKDLKKEVERGRFRKDLFYRLNVLPIYLPPLVERKSDIHLLFQHFMREFSEKYEKKEVKLTDESYKILENYNWPGNVREVENIVEQTIIAEAFPMDYFNVDKEVYGANKNNKLSEGLQKNAVCKTEDLNMDTLEMSCVEKNHLIKVLKIFNGNISQSAQALGIQRNTLYSKINKYKIEL